jgi:hypothetical protein
MIRPLVRILLVTACLAPPIASAATVSGLLDNFPGTFVPPPNAICPGGALVIDPAPAASAAQGSITLFGVVNPFTAVLRECPVGPPPASTAGNRFTFTFADGTLTGTYFSTLTSASPVRFDAFFTVTGGTGRFATATGAFSGNGGLFFDGPGAIIRRSFAGTIATPEPAGLLLLGLGGAALVAARRRAAQR